MSIVADKVKAAFGRPVVVLGVMLVAYVALGGWLPLATAVKIGAEEDYELPQGVPCLTGHRPCPVPDEAALLPTKGMKLPPTPLRLATPMIPNP